MVYSVTFIRLQGGTSGVHLGNCFLSYLQHVQLHSTSPPPSHWYAQVAGKVPIPPRYAFGIFYSRYWAYNDIGDGVCIRVYLPLGLSELVVM